jgi:glycosyltransferase involved in cell wall biosynthesis
MRSKHGRDNYIRMTPIYLNVFNNLNRGFKGLIEWLQLSGEENIIIIDNNSTYEPLLEYYETLPYEIIRSSQNLGHEAFWKLGINPTEQFILSDPDVVPDKNCPKDLVRKMIEVSDRYGTAKVGPGIRIDNLPDHYHLKDLMLRSECRYWDESARTPEGDSFFADIDTTFALYQPEWGRWPPAKHVRLDFPYVVEHVPWYLPSNEYHEEREYYKNTVLPGISHSQ